ncbi:hypothetical protein EVAR_63707_1 [Eumeta japonica]|uniref:Uncharacterized protein n=1 Tax=Eumeta variegata TaxID=151549 RepID=A0A4C1ZWG3_EUMVA|nr:hypothetical protein EVAR_63707_1 [Eumeta japonica]
MGALLFCETRIERSKGKNPVFIEKNYLKRLIAGSPRPRRCPGGCSRSHRSCANARGPPAERAVPHIPLRSKTVETYIEKRVFTAHAPLGRRHEKGCCGLDATWSSARTTRRRTRGRIGDVGGTASTNYLKAQLLTFRRKGERTMT